MGVFGEVRVTDFNGCLLRGPRDLCNLRDRSSKLTTSMAVYQQSQQLRLKIQQLTQNTAKLLAKLSQLWKKTENLQFYGKVKRSKNWLIDWWCPSRNISTIIQYLDKFSANCFTVYKIQINRCIFYYWQNRAITTLNLHWEPMSRTVLWKSKEIKKNDRWCFTPKQQYFNYNSIFRQVQCRLFAKCK